MTLGMYFVIQNTEMPLLLHEHQVVTITIKCTNYVNLTIFELMHCYFLFIFISTSPINMSRMSSSISMTTCCKRTNLFTLGTYFSTALN